MLKSLKILLIGIAFVSSANQPYTVKIGVLKYQGGGDWYSNPTALSNLAVFANQNIGSQINPDYDVVEVGSTDIFNYPFIHMTGHGNVVFSEKEQLNLRLYLEAGGFLHIDDNYGMDKYIRTELKKIFPETDLQAIPKSHPIFNQHFKFPEGLPKIHEHDNKPPAIYAIILEGRIAVLYTSESDLGDGWEDEEVHNDPAEVRLKALQMGANILEYAFKTSNRL